MAANKVRVLIIDDSSIVRSILRGALSQHPHIEVVGLARDGHEGLAKIAELRPDVVTLDVEMPRLNGIRVLERVPAKAPVAFVMVSTLTQSGAQITMEALQKGAFDFVTKPTRGLGQSPEFRERLFEKVLAAARSKTRRRVIASTKTPSSAPSLPPNTQRAWIVAIGISCGGPQTLMSMMPVFPSDFPPILITQHMPGQFTPSFAKHLDAACSMKAKEASHQDRPEPGTIYVAPGGRHMRLVRRGMNLVIELDDEPPVSRHRPSVDVLFESVARSCPTRSVGVIMTGMGDDGVVGLGMMREAGAWTIGQDQQTSIVYGMPKEAAKAGALDYTVPLSKIPLAISKLMQRGPKPACAPV